MESIFIGVIVSLVVFYLGILEKRISDMHAKIDVKTEADDVDRMISTEVKVLRNEQSNLKEDLTRIEDKLDKLLDRFTIR